MKEPKRGKNEGTKPKQKAANNWKNGDIKNWKTYTKKDNGSNKRSRAKNMIIILIRDVWSLYVCKKKDETTRYWIKLDLGQKQILLDNSMSL
jgi:hypothetical protein